MLAPSNRLHGICAFMRVRNGADFIEATIRSHIQFYDEIVVVYNQCNDATPDVLGKLVQEFGSKLRVFHYLPRVFPAGSDGHKQTPGDAPSSLVTYSNFALAQTRHQWVVKLDDDHLAMTKSVDQMVRDIRDGRASDDIMHCFSGLNLVRRAPDNFGIPAADPISGKGDIGYFRITPETYFTYDPRYERFERGSIKRRFAGWFYWHLKFLKTGGGFANYELASNPTSRFVRRQRRMAESQIWDLSEARYKLNPGLSRRLRALIDEKARLEIDRDLMIPMVFSQHDVVDALDTTAPGWRNWLEIEG